MDEQFQRKVSDKEFPHQIIKHINSSSNTSLAAIGHGQLVNHITFGIWIIIDFVGYVGYIYIRFINDPGRIRHLRNRIELD